jgi:hypothetical protein
MSVSVTSPLQMHNATTFISSLPFPKAYSKPSRKMEPKKQQEITESYQFVFHSIHKKERKRV